MAKELIVMLNDDIQVLKDTAKLHEDLRNSVVFDNCGNPQIDELLKAQIKNKHSFTFQSGEKYKGLLINDYTVKVFNSDKTESIEINIDNPIIHSFTQDNNLPSEYSHYTEGCWAVCLKDYATQGKTETLEKYKLYQLSEIKYNEKTKKVTANVTGSKYKWNVSRFRVVNTEFLDPNVSNKSDFSREIQSMKEHVQKYLISPRIVRIIDGHGLSKNELFIKLNKLMHK